MKITTVDYSESNLYFLDLQWKHNKTGYLYRIHISLIYFSNSNIVEECITLQEIDDFENTKTLKKDRIRHKNWMCDKTQKVGKII